MNIIERARSFLQGLLALHKRTAWEWRQCPHCGSRVTVKWGHYLRRPWFFEGRQVVYVQRHRCCECGKSYAEQSARLVRGSWYAREVQRWAIDGWLHRGSSLRRTAEEIRSWLGKQERYQIWRPWTVAPPAAEQCYLAASTLHRWLDGAGRAAQASVPGQLQGIGQTQQVGTDGLWARLRGRSQRVVLLLVDSVNGLIWPPVVARGEESAGPWLRLFQRAAQAGLDLERLRGVTSDGATGVAALVHRTLYWIMQQRCVWHMWRSLREELARAISQAAAGVAQEMAALAQEQARRELVALIHSVLDAPSYAAAEAALATLQGHPLGARIAHLLHAHLDHLLLYLGKYYQGLQRITPEWYWRDFRLRLSRGRNHRSEQRLERAALLWAIYHNFTPAQRRSERKRHYRHPGQSALEVAGAPPGQLSYLDALSI